LRFAGVNYRALSGPVFCFLNPKSESEPVENTDFSYELSSLFRYYKLINQQALAANKPA
jgi:hypothetical protein